ncbi:RES domain-containing protein [Caulobacter segnis]|uniref:RES domain-containing protein n=1 Tax=Caulobacter segnis TaxID=88688 RepID=A0A2W5WGR9_9CAUL|nr:RES domain-containing protein [Caulobacter segnis]PZR32838.1 MAG: hypothetical protein DI526_15370 [Caulobacter segnis]
MTLLCPDCFGNKGLSRRIAETRPRYDEGQCTFHPRRKGVPIEAVAELVDVVFRANYTYAGADYVEYDPEEPGDYQARGADLADTVQELAEADDDEVNQALVAQLIEDDFYLPQRGEDPFYDDDFRYERIDGDGGHGVLWERFCQIVTYEQRFLNSEVADLLSEIFKHIHLQRALDRRPPVRVISTTDDLKIHRARLVTDADLTAIAKDPHGQLGPPPRRLGKSNRMNPAGIPAFYGALDLKTCVAELRPSVGAKVAYGSFRPARDLVVLDTTLFSAPPKELNLFAADHVRRLAQWRFMQRFMFEIAKPISPSDEPFDYVPTQIVAEYLNKIHQVRIGRGRRPIDGIIYRSAQRPQGGVNIVLMGDAGRIEPIASESSATERRKPKGVWRTQGLALVQELGQGMASGGDRAAPSPAGLRLIPESLESIEIEAAEYLPTDPTPARFWPADETADGDSDEDWPF